MNVYRLPASLYRLPGMPLVHGVYWRAYLLSRFYFPGFSLIISACLYVLPSVYFGGFCFIRTTYGRFHTTSRDCDLRRRGWVLCAVAKKMGDTSKFLAPL